ncbi:MAG TPA: pyridoxine 5'-phosphate synthase [Phycisphaerae bacterium]|nr:pyridoxine 5'-phosphate synthase [Phycisphaerae bacterium]
MARLGVNIDHVATVRQARKADEPDPVWAAVEAELGGADCITFHLREDRRHISDRDAEVLRRTVATKLNMEMSVAAPIVKIALALRPAQCTLVPERREEITTEGGLDVVRLRRRIAPVVHRLKRAGVLSSAFVEPRMEQVRACAEIGFDAIELWTGAYAHARSAAQREKQLEILVEALDAGLEAGLTVHAGHGLTYRNVEPLAAIQGFDEFNIGHTIVSRAVLVGMREAVREMKAILLRCERQLLLCPQDHEHAPDERG